MRMVFPPNAISQPFVPNHLNRTPLPPGPPLLVVGSAPCASPGSMTFAPAAAAPANPAPRICLRKRPAASGSMKHMFPPWDERGTISPSMKAGFHLRKMLRRLAPGPAGLERGRAARGAERAQGGDHRPLLRGAAGKLRGGGVTSEHSLSHVDRAGSEVSFALLLTGETMQTTRRYRLLGIGVVALNLIGATVLLAEEAAKAPAAATTHVMVTTADLKWVDGPPSLPPGAKVAGMEGNPKEPGLFTMRLKFPANYKIAPHWHPADEHVTVISGTFYMGMGDKFDEAAAKELPTGSFVVMPTKQAHFGMTKGETVVQLHGTGPWGVTYVNPADDPRSKAAAKK